MLVTELHHSDSWFRQLIDTAPVMVWTSGVDALCNFFNLPWLEFTGRTMEQEVGNGWTAGVHPEDYARCCDVYLSSFEERVTFQMEYRLRRHDGEYRWILDNGKPLYAPSGAFMGYIGSCIDITETKQAAERAERLEQEKHARAKAEEAERRAWILAKVSGSAATLSDPEAVLQALPALLVPSVADACVVYRLDEQGSISRLEPAYGDPAAAPPPQTFVQETIGNDPLLPVVARVLRTGTAERIERPADRTRMLPAGAEGTSTGIAELRSFVVASLQSRGQVLGALVYGFKDPRPSSIPEDLRFAEELASRAAAGVLVRREVREYEHAEDTLRGLIEAAPVPIVALDPEGYVQTWNSAAERVFGWSAGEVLGRPYPIIPEHARSEFRLRLDSVLQGQAIQGEEAVRRRKDGSAVEVQIFTSPIRDTRGVIVGTIAVLEDITARKHLERMRARVLQVLGHDLRTPLTSILLSADQLASGADGTRSEEAASDLLHTIVSSVEQMELLARDILDLGLVEAGEMSLVRDPVPADVLLRDAVAVLQPLARAKSIRLDVSSPPEVWIYAERRRLLQVISNLVSNALRFTSEGGRISIGVETMERDVLFSVVDTGCGIPEEDLPYIFQRYWKPHTAGTTGLGLAIAKGIVESHGGRIWVDSIPGEGSRFRFTLPRLTEPPPLE